MTAAEPTAVVLARHDVRLSAAEKTLDDHEDRLRWLSRLGWLVTGACAVGGGALGSIAVKLLG